jgi:hypothetical protein
VKTLLLTLFEFALIISLLAAVALGTMAVASRAVGDIYNQYDRDAGR